MARYWEWSDAFEIIPEETALIIVDMQKGFVDEGYSLYTPQAREQLPLIADFKKFCNEKGIPVFMSVFAQDTDYHNDFYWARNKERGLLHEDGTCKLKLGTDDCVMTEALEPIEEDVVFTKYTYSCFAHTELETMLKKRKIRTVIVCGTCTDWCVDSTIRDAYHRDFNVVAMADGVSTYPHAGADPETWNSMELDLWAEGFASVKTAADLKEIITKNLDK